MGRTRLAERDKNRSDLHVLTPNPTEDPMKPAMIFAVFAFTILPGLAAAAGCRGEHSDQTAASCIPGMIWDSGKGTCVEKPTS